MAAKPKEQYEDETIGPSHGKKGSIKL